MGFLCKDHGSHILYWFVFRIRYLWHLDLYFFFYKIYVTTWVFIFILFFSYIYRKCSISSSFFVRSSARGGSIMNEIESATVSDTLSHSMNRKHRDELSCQEMPCTQKSPYNRTSKYSTYLEDVCYIVRAFSHRYCYVFRRRPHWYLRVI